MPEGERDRERERERVCVCEREERERIRHDKTLKAVVLDLVFSKYRLTAFGDTKKKL
jgi:hypothetical protein